MVGVDAGITSLVTLSTGEKVTNPRHEHKVTNPRHEHKVTNPRHEHKDRVRLAKAQRTLARKAKGSKNRVKARAISDAAWRDLRGMLEYKCAW